MTDLSALTADDFEPLVGEAFLRPLPDGGDVALVLAAVDRGRTTPEGREAFTLLLDGPADPVLEPDVHPLTHATLGRLDLFVGPIAGSTPGAPGVRYQIVFA